MKYLKTFNQSFRINESEEAAKSKVLDFLYSDEIKQSTGVTSFQTCDESDWDKVKDYIEKEKKFFLENNKDVTEQQFDKFYDEWLDYIEDERGYESRNQQDLNW